MHRYDNTTKKLTSYEVSFFVANNPISMNPTKTKRKMKNNTFAIPTAAPAIEVNPRRPAMIATTRNTRLHLSIKYFRCIN